MRTWTFGAFTCYSISPLWYCFFFLNKRFEFLFHRWCSFSFTIKRIISWCYSELFNFNIVNDNFIFIEKATSLLKALQVFSLLLIKPMLRLEVGGALTVSMWCQQTRSTDEWLRWTLPGLNRCDEATRRGKDGSTSQTHPPSLEEGSDRAKGGNTSVTGPWRRRALLVLEPF